MHQPKCCDCIQRMSEWDYPECHTRHDRDVNAALNILCEGQARFEMKRTQTPEETCAQKTRRRTSKLPASLSCWRKASTGSGGVVHLPLSIFGNKKTRRQRWIFRAKISFSSAINLQAACALLQWPGRSKTFS